MKRLQFSLTILLVLSCLVCFKCGKKEPVEQVSETDEKEAAEVVDPIENKIIIQINEKQLTNKDFRRFLQVQYPGLAGNPEEGLSPRLLSRIFDTWVEHRIILYFAQKDQIPINEKDYEEYLGELKIRRETIDRAAHADAVKVQKFLFYKVYNHIAVSDTEISEYYRKNLEEFRKKPEVLLYQILVKDRETALKIRGTLKNEPEKFETIAKEQSISMEASKGGFMGYFEKGTLPKDMEDVVFSLQPYTISPVVESPYGFHIFKITKKKRGRLLFLKAVKSEIKNKLLSNRLRESYRNFLDQAKQNVKININHDQLYFDYQPVDKNDIGGKGDENKKTINTDDAGDSS